MTITEQKKREMKIRRGFGFLVLFYVEGVFLSMSHLT